MDRTALFSTIKKIKKIIKKNKKKIHVGCQQMIKIQETIVYFALLNVKMVKYIVSFYLPRLSAQGNPSHKV